MFRSVGLGVFHLLRAWSAYLLGPYVGSYLATFAVTQDQLLLYDAPAVATQETTCGISAHRLLQADWDSKDRICDFCAILVTAWQLPSLMPRRHL
jgi:hypothetical protein